ncbi:hypothetical protein MBLNU457_4181t2 [Dothideomycetes sp. NU457]
MADQLKEIAEIPRDFLKDGTQFLNRCTKRECALSHPQLSLWTILYAALLERHIGSAAGHFATRRNTQDRSSQLSTARTDKREFIKISQAVGVGFLVMGVIGYVVKLIHIPVNNILVGGA